MASKSLARTLGSLRASICSINEISMCRSTSAARTITTETLKPDTVVNSLEVIHPSESKLPSDSHVLTTIYQFPTMEPLRFEAYPSNHLHLPLRRDLLHRAVIFEGDATRQGTASSKTRYEVAGSHRKVRPQKGGGVARLGTRQSPMLVGGGKTFGPHPRDFSTELPRKMYDLAWRTALSYRYRKGELIVCEDGMEVDHARARYVKNIFQHNRWGSEHGGSLVITSSMRTNLFGALGRIGQDGRAQTVPEVDVKDLLKLGRIIIEKSALDMILREHQRDLVSKVALSQ